MPRVGLLADDHAGMRNNSLVFMEHQIRFHEEQFLPFCKENKVEYLIHLGDVFECRPYTNTNIFHEWDRRVFKKWQEQFKEVHIVIGNHDVYFKNTNIINAPEELLSKYDNFTFYRDPTELELLGMKALILPWICKDNEAESARMLEASTADIVFGHLEIMGCPMFKGVQNLDHGFNQSIFKKFKRVLSGHFHLKSQQGNIDYLGSAHPRMWDEAFDIRGFHILDSASLKTKFIEREKNPFVKVEYDDSSVESIPDVENRMVMVDVKNKSSEAKFLEFLEAVENKNPAEVNVQDKFVLATLEDSPDENMDLFSLIDFYVDSLEFETPKPELKVALRELYQEAVALHDISE